MKGPRLLLKRFGDYTINLDRVVAFQKQREDGRPTGRILVYGGDQIVTIEGDEAESINRFIDESVMGVSVPDQPPPRASGSADPSAP